MNIISSADTILNICRNQEIDSVRHYKTDGTPADYPSALMDAGINYSPNITISKNAASVILIIIQDVKNTNGEPHAIFGYCNASKLFWGPVL